MGDRKAHSVYLEWASVVGVAGVSGVADMVGEVESGRVFQDGGSVGFLYS